MNEDLAPDINSPSAVAEECEAMKSDQQSNHADLSTRRASTDRIIGRCYFLELPKELRLQIYELLSPHSLSLISYDWPDIAGLSPSEIASTRVKRKIHSDENEHYHFSLLQTCRQLYAEAISTLYLPKHLDLYPSREEPVTAVAAPPFPAVRLLDLKSLQTLTVFLCTTEETAAEDLAHSQFFIGSLRRTLKVQELVVYLPVNCLGDARLTSGWFQSLEVLGEAWASAELGQKVSVWILFAPSKAVAQEVAPHHEDFLDCDNFYTNTLPPEEHDTKTESNSHMHSHSEPTMTTEGGQEHDILNKVTGHCYLLDLPKELRLQIYELLAPERIRLRTYDQPTIVGLTAQEIATTRVYRRCHHNSAGSRDKQCHTDILCTCRQVYDEANLAFKRPQNAKITPSMAGAPSQDRGYHALYAGLRDICVLESLTVNLVTTAATAVEDLAQSQAVISVFRPTLKVQRLTLELEDYDPGVILIEEVISSLEALLKAWLGSGIGIDINVTIVWLGDHMVKWGREEGGEWEQEGPGYDLDGLSITHFSAREEEC
ncbi:hypothetical protein LTR56_025764 [Elasticomyces elasticus]|nr:hypothetical protein LTR56_025764 [Elasticomyces elasticus]KAK3617968.1 hypothetical protein LTR22_026533 [Elasticomyces elasticus]KAK4907886.1 hypothetical protein LTR49_023160 [Elasticomyces elasticus]KAK5739343.1 hypothetical protein LTS12_025314 [Elasticomyces elasticus]